jgi:hypothetical protein
MEQKVRTFKSWLVVIFSIESLFFAPLIMPILVIATYSQLSFMEFTPARKDHYEFMHWGYDIIATILNIVIVIMHHSFVRYSAARYFGLNIPFWRIIEYYAFLLIGMWIILVPSIIVNVISRATKRPEYITAPKKHNVDEEQSKQSQHLTDS